MQYLQKFSGVGNETSPWRMHPDLFKSRAEGQAVHPGIINLSPGWLQQGHEVCAAGLILVASSKLLS